MRARQRKPLSLLLRKVSAVAHLYPQLGGKGLASILELPPRLIDKVYRLLSLAQDINTVLQRAAELSTQNIDLLIASFMPPTDTQDLKRSTIEYRDTWLRAYSSPLSQNEAIYMAGFLTSTFRKAMGSDPIQEATLLSEDFAQFLKFSPCLFCNAPPGAEGWELKQHVEFPTRIPACPSCSIDDLVPSLETYRKYAYLVADYCKYLIVAMERLRGLT